MNTDMKTFGEHNSAGAWAYYSADLLQRLQFENAFLVLMPLFFFGG